MFIVTARAELVLTGVTGSLSLQHTQQAPDTACTGLNLCPVWEETITHWSASLHIRQALCVCSPLGVIPAFCTLSG